VPPRPVSNPPNPWLSTDVEWLEPAPARLEVFEDATRQILSRNDSPDVPFRWSVNPYRGCGHACAYCYARPTHEYLGFGAGSDFETRLTVKPRAAALLRAAFDRPSWKGELIAFSGNTDCYQPLEAGWRLTRACLEVCAEYRNPVSIVTKAPLVERDLDLLLRLGAEARLSVTLSIPFLDTAHARALEPGVATPARRLETVRRLSAAGVRCGVLVAPVIPGLNDEALARLLAAARDAGATRAAWLLLKLPGSAAQVFEERLRATLPGRAERVLHRIREVRGGALDDRRFGARMRGEGPYARAIDDLFRAAARRAGFADGSDDRAGEPATTFRRPAPGQLSLL
jgi:DNA repair photolyase